MTQGDLSLKGQPGERSGKRGCKESPGREGRVQRGGKEGEREIKEEGVKARVGTCLRAPACRIGPQLDLVRASLLQASVLKNH